MDKQKCSVRGCSKDGKARNRIGLVCYMHAKRYSQFGNFGQAKPKLFTRNGLCKVDGCKRKIYGKMLCSLHLQRINNHGTFEIGKRARLTLANMDDIKRAMMIETNINDITGCWEWNGNLNADGYAYRNVGGRRYFIHRLSAFIHFGFNLNSSLCVCHQCDNRKCWNPDHLFIGTRRDNFYDMIKKSRGNHIIGEENNNSKLKEKDVLKIRQERYSGARRIDLAKKYGVTPQHIYYITSKKSWTHI